MTTIQIDYEYVLPQDEVVRFHLTLDPQKLELIDFAPTQPPDWTALTYHQCSHCPLSPESHPHCPAALNIAAIVDDLGQVLSYEEVHVTIHTQERMISQQTSAQDAVSALMGLVMATSGCPHTAFFKPMARFHLPLASTLETMYRSISMYLLAQFFLGRLGKQPDFELTGLMEIYQNMEIVNQAMVNRLTAASKSDVSLNALVLLDLHAKLLPLAMQEILFQEYLDEIKALFAQYFDTYFGLILERPADEAEDLEVGDQAP